MFLNLFTLSAIHLQSHLNSLVKGHTEYGTRFHVPGSLTSCHCLLPPLPVLSPLFLIADESNPDSKSGTTTSSSSSELAAAAAAAGTTTTMTGKNEHVSFQEFVKIREVDSLDEDHVLIPGEDEEVDEEDTVRPSAETDQSEEGERRAYMITSASSPLSFP